MDTILPKNQMSEEDIKLNYITPVGKNMKKKDLEEAAGASHYVMNKMSHGEDISTEAVRRICKALGCRSDKMMDFNYDDV